MTDTNAAQVSRIYKSTVFIMLSDLYAFKEEECKLELKAELLNICGDNNKA